MQINKQLLEKAKALEPTLFRRTVSPTSEVRLFRDETKRLGWSAEPYGTFSSFCNREFSQDDVAILDFGEHLVGYLSMDIGVTRNHADSPVRLKLTFGEMPCDTAIPPETFSGLLGRSWLQTEIVTVDDLPCRVELPRRYAFRYLRIEIIGLSPYFCITFPSVACTAVTSADERNLTPLPENTDPLLKQIDAAACRTLRDNMQSVVEDGPKRDRRFWTFDTWLGMKANPYTYRNYDMAKRLIYLTAAYRHDDGNCIACCYVQPTYEPGHEYITEHSATLIFMLKDYVDATNDKNLLYEIWPIAKGQLHLTASKIGADGLVDPMSYLAHWSNADKQMEAQGFLSLLLREYADLAAQANDFEERDYAIKTRTALIRAVRSKLYDAHLGLYVSGDAREISWRSQIWAMVSGIAEKCEVDGLLARAKAYPDCHPMESTTTYAMYIQAMIDCDRRDLALDMIKTYFGAMLNEGADTFFEHFNLGWTFPCPYRHILMDSYCHSCQAIAAYFIRKYFIE